MNIRTLTLTAFFLTSMLACATPHSHEATHQQPAPSGYAPVNGIKMYYEIHGPESETPLVLIHGGGSTIDSTFSKILPLLSKNRRVIALEEQGHGRTEGRVTRVSFTQTADDVAELLKYLKIPRADVFGFSNGASAGMQLAIRHPEVVRKLIFASSITKRSGAVDGFWNIFKAPKCNMPAVLQEAFLKVNPHRELLDKMCEGDFLRMRDFIETSDRDVKKVAAPTLVMFGDKDIVRPQHGAELIKLLPNGHLVILPGTHGSYLGDVSAGPNDPRVIEATALLTDSFLSN